MAFRTHIVLFRWTVRGAVVLFTVLLTVVAVRAFDSRGLSDLKLWHRVHLEAEFTVARADSVGSLDDWLQVENRLFEQLDTLVYDVVDPSTTTDVNRYVKGSRSDPEHFESNWDRTYEMRPAVAKGGALLIHGLSDSPYSVRHIAEILVGQGYYVLCMRMPGHGTVPSGLLHANWRDWAAAVEIGARHVATQVPHDGHFVLGGYSNGGALALNYVADAIDDGNLPIPDQMVLFSPMLGVSPFAVLANIHKLLSWIPYFEKSKWVDVYPEYDPFKYNSFPMEAGHQSYRLIRTIVGKLDRLAKDGSMNQLPPIIAFQSLVDATVSTEAIVDKLFDRLEGNNDELVLFDVNQTPHLKDFIEPKYDRSVLLASLETVDALPYKLTVITNHHAGDREVAARTKLSGEADSTLEPLNLSWPEEVYSLAHVAIPFPPSDAVYGDTKGSLDGPTINIGTLRPRGEKGVLNVPPSLMMRLRYNPFFDYVKRRIMQKTAALEQ